MRKRTLARVAAEKGTTIKKLHYLFEVRFIESKTKVLDAILWDMPVIALDLRSALSSGAKAWRSRKLSARLRSRGKDCAEPW